MKSIRAALYLLLLPSLVVADDLKVGSVIYKDFEVLKVDHDGIRILHSEGAAKIRFAQLSPELQKKYGYDPKKAAEKAAAPNPAAAPAASKAAPFINTLGMEFVPVRATPGVLWSRWETRVRDYAAFCLETKRDHKKPDFEQGDDHPVVNVSFNDAQAFCVWLSKKEGRAYRLPTDHEWSCAVGIGAQEDAAASTKEKKMGIKGVYPWGTAWPPPEGSGNFDSYSEDKISSDLYDNTSPVGSFSPTADGLYDLSGNAWEWCDRLYDPNETRRVLRGGTWYDVNPTILLSSYRNGDHPTFRGDLIGFRVVLGVGGGG